MKSRSLPLVIGVVCLGIGLAVYATINSTDLKKAIEKERYQRLAAEQTLLKAQQKIADLEADLGDAKSKMSSIEKILTDGRAAEMKLKAELEVVKKEREALQDQKDQIDQIVPVE